MTEERVDTIVVGAGHAGLAMSGILRSRSVPHVVLERDKVGSSWRQRWASFHLNTPNAINRLPGLASHEDGAAFMARDGWVKTLVDYRAKQELPVREGVEVQKLIPEEQGYRVLSSQGTLLARRVVLCSGDQNVPKIPALSRSFPAAIHQRHSSQYDRPEELPQGAVLVVGCGQSGAQIVEDLLEAGRKVWLCTSKVGRAPRRYRGRDITDWATSAGLMDAKTEDVPLEERQARQGMISGTRGGHSISLQLLANEGAELLGRLEGVEGGRLRIAGDLMEHVALGDAERAKIGEGLDQFIEATGVEAGPAQVDAADKPCPRLESMAQRRHLDLIEEGISSVIWATGYGWDFSYLPEVFLDEEGRPRHDRGLIAPGLACLGLTWLRRRASGLIAGAWGDAEALADRLLGSSAS